MATSSIVGGERPPMEPKGTVVDSLGPSDTSDSGSDVRTSRERTARPDGPDDMAEGAIPVAHDSSSDAAGTGERASADAPPSQTDADILPDSMAEAGELADLDEGDPDAAGEEDRR